MQVLHIDDVIINGTSMWRWSGGHYYHVLQIDDAIMDDDVLRNWPSVGDEISIVAHASVVLEEERRYLAFINPHSLDGRLVAKINEDRSITATRHLGFYFREYDGYTVEQLREIAKEILVYGYTPAWEVPESCIFEMPSETTVIPGDTWIFHDVGEVSRTATDIIRAKVLDSRVEVLDISSGESIPGIDMSIFHHLHTIYSLNVLEVFKGDSAVGSVLEVAHNLQLQIHDLTITPGDDLIFFIQRDEMFSHLPMGITGAYQGVFRATLPDLPPTRDTSESIIEAHQANILDGNLVLEAVAKDNHLKLTVGDLVRISETYARR